MSIRISPSQREHRYSDHIFATDGQQHRSQLQVYQNDELTSASMGTADPSKKAIFSYESYNNTENHDSPSSSFFLTQVINSSPPPLPSPPSAPIDKNAANWS